MNKAPIIVAIAGDPGGAAAVAPVLDLLRRQGRTVRALAYRQAVAQWRDRGLDVDELPASTALESAQQRLCALNADLLLSGTSDSGPCRSITRARNRAVLVPPPLRAARGRD